MTPRRKRRPGGGRKPLGNFHGKSENFSTRITSETRQALDREAKRSVPRKSVSQVAEELIRLGLAQKRNRQCDEPMRALAFLIDRLAIQIAAPHRGSKQDFRWRTNPFLFRALQEAIYQLMNRLAPEGDPLAVPLEVKDGPRTPQDRAGWAVDIVWHLFRDAVPGAMEREPYSAMPEHLRATGEVLLSAFQQARDTLHRSQG
jgi:hypothetical protein